METGEGNESSFELHLQGATIEEVLPVQQEEAPPKDAETDRGPAPWGLKKDGTPKSPPGRKPRANDVPPLEGPARPPASVSRPMASPSPSPMPASDLAGSPVAVDPVKKTSFLFTPSASPVTSSDRKDRAIRHQLLFSGVVRLSASALDRLPPSPMVVNPLAALIALKEEREQALFLPNVMMGVALSQVVASVVLAKPLSEASQTEIDSANRAYDDLLKVLSI